MEIMIDLQGGAKAPLYEKIYESIKNEIVSGKLLRGEKLPSTRRLAQGLSVSRSTVDLAYEQLRAEGYIKAEPCRGFFVCDITGLYSLHQEIQKEGEIVRSTVDLAYEQLRAEGYIKAEPCRGFFVCDITGLYSLHQEIQKEGEIVSRGTKALRESGQRLPLIDFSPYAVDTENFPYNIWRRLSKNVLLDDREELLLAGDGQGDRVLGTKALRESGQRLPLIDFSPYAVDTENFPYNIWRRLSKNVLLDDREELLLAGDGQGDRVLRETIAAYLHQARGVNCLPDQIIVGAGNEYLEILLSQILGRKQTVLMEDPGYPQAYRTFLNMGYKVITVPALEDGLCMSEVRRLAPSLVYVMPSHQFPVGSVMALGKRLELLEWAAEGEGRYLIEDDHDSEYRYRGKPIPSLQSIDRFGRVIYLGTFSKSIAPSLRISYLVEDDHDSEYRYRGKPIPSLQSIDRFGRVIYLGTFSKSIAPSLRISYLVLPPKLLERYHCVCGFYAATVPRMQQELVNSFIRSKSIAPSLRISYLVLPPKLLERYHCVCGFYAATVPRMQQELVNSFIREGHFERHLNKMRGIYRARHDFLLAELKKRRWVRRVIGEHAGLHLLVEVQTQEQEEELCRRAEEFGVRVSGIRQYYLKQGEEAACMEECASGNGEFGTYPVLLLGYGRLCEQELAQGLEGLDALFGKRSDLQSPTDIV